MSTKEELNFRIPSVWYTMIKNASYVIGVSMSDLMRLGIIKGLIRIYIEGYAVIDVARESSTSSNLIPVKTSVPKWLKSALRSFAQDLDMDISSLVRACLFVGLELYKGAVSINVGLSEAEKRFVEILRSTFGDGGEDG